MPIWKDSSAPATPTPAPQPAARDLPPAPAPAPTPTPTSRGGESLLAADLTIEGTISGRGSLRVAGKFKGDLNVQGNLAIEPGAKVTGAVRAEAITIAGELEGNIEGAKRVELQQGGTLVGDLTAATFTVASGARMRGRVEFGWDEAGARRGGEGPAA
ncbi:MAG TPA: polymer-forming cytoskeletal protein [Gemmatimonadales bacterium]|nr:polymer-forming cytoskeletal protein [Gemmatimonadales bacterium]